MGFESKRRVASRMHCCPSCDSILVQPVAFHQHGDEHWKVELRCPECGRRNWDTYTRDEVERYEIELDRGDQELIEDLRALSRANMREEADRFADALASDRIIPDDFHGGGLSD